MAYKTSTESCDAVWGRTTASDKPAYDAAIRVATALVGIYGLFVIKLRESFLVGVPFDMPKISWSMHRGYIEDSVIAGSATPTFEEGKLRAEVALRVHLGITNGRLGSRLD